MSSSVVLMMSCGNCDSSISSYSSLFSSSLDPRLFRVLNVTSSIEELKHVLGYIFM
ncbi:unnamed protein product [Moneuplotes crassus]|uniref:Uncharacterized protein n=1 Tax=Euplotes crassus TaxID=5936 RepID=A0AAD1XXL4_EUPCR|nr:unnamed protein product [Moneuplotes crassus]